MDDAARHAPALGALERATVSLVGEPGAGGPAPADDELAARVHAGRELAAPWLAGVGTARTVEDALGRRTALAPHRSLVTPDGTWVGPNWIRVFRRRDDESGPLAREREIGSLRQSLGASGSEAEAHEMEIERIRRDLAVAETDRESLEMEWTEINDRYARRRSEHAARVAEAKARRRRREELDRELEELDGAVVELGAAIEERESAMRAVREAGERFASDGAAFDGRAERHEAEVSAARGSAEGARQAAHEAALALESSTVQAAALEEARLRSDTRMEALRGDMEESRPASRRDGATHRRCREEASRAPGEPPESGGRSRANARGGGNNGE